MEKISKVVPSSSKYNIDMSKERPMRSGMPNYGLPVSMSATQEKRVLEAEAFKRQSQIEKENSAEANSQAAIVDQVTLSFKKTNENPNQIENTPLTLSPENSIDSMSEDDSEGPKQLSLYA